MAFRKQVSPKVFKAIENMNVEALCGCTAEEIRPVLPSLVRMGLISPLDTSRKCASQKVGILTIIAAIEWVNSIVALLSINFHVLEVDVRKEQQLRQKLNGTAGGESVLAGSLSHGMALDYERADMTRRLRLVLSEILFIQSQIQEAEQSGQEQDFYLKTSELFDNDIYVEEISDVICIALAELPTILNVSNIIEVLLHVQNGPAIICRIVANFPDTFRETCTQLILKGEKQEENLSSTIRASTITYLCRMNPSQALSVRAKCVELCRLPALAVALSVQLETSESLDGGGDMVAFISGLLLGNDQAVRAWFALFIRTGQKRKGEVSYTALQQLRDELVRRLQALVDSCREGLLPDSNVVQASALLRLYCALRGIAAIKFQDDEVNLLVQLLTSHPNPTPAGVRFVSIGLCMLIACPSLIAVVEHERRSIEWVQWLVREEAYFESASGVSASFGEMLLLMAIHFHSNQLSAICDLVCATLGMKIPIRHNNMNRMKQVFTQEIFTEQIVTTHAVKVPVTQSLNGSMAGFLPIHCIHQLLKSRAFAKHNVNIKHWIYRQICQAGSPLHPVLPQLVEVYVLSVIAPAQIAISTGGARNSAEPNKPLTENEIRRVFQNSVFGQYLSLRILPSTEHLQLDGGIDGEPEPISRNTVSPQLLLLYYLLLYEDIRLQHAGAPRKIKTYSAEFLSELPIKYLLHHAQKDQSSYATLFGPLLKLLATHFPHLTLVDDWVDDLAYGGVVKTTRRVTKAAIAEALGDIKENPSKCARIFQQLLEASEIDIWMHAELITQYSVQMLDAHVPRYLQDLYKEVWFRLNAVLPRTLWVMTVRNLVGKFTGLTRIDVSEDPLQIMRCDDRVFRCAPIFCIVMRVLRASLQSSRSHLTQHLLSHPKLDPQGQAHLDVERDEMCRALIAAQVSLGRGWFIKSDITSNSSNMAKRRAENREERDSKRPVLIDFYDYKNDLAAYLEGNFHVRDTQDFFRFYTKYLAAQRVKKNTSLDRSKLFPITFTASGHVLADRFPLYKRNGDRLPSNERSFAILLEAVLTYQDFQQKGKFAKLLQLRRGQRDLPIATQHAEILRELRAPGVLLIAGDTGCGKSTQLPQYVLEAGFQRVAVTQPRRLACVALAARVAHETLSTYKHRVGYQIRFERAKNKATNVIFLTEGILLRQASDGDVLKGYDCIILDEVHERHLNMDFLIGIMKCVIRQQGVKLVLMSATINLRLFEEYFRDDGVKTIQVPGRLYPIDIMYKPILKDAYDPKKRDNFDAQPYLNILEFIDAKYKPHEKGDVLIFLQGLQEIQTLSAAVQEYAEAKKQWIVLQLHSTLSLEEQDKVFYQAPENTRKCIVATNIAETSVTIDGVRFVIDSGKCNRMHYERCGVNRLFTTDISQDSAKQRAGRAGRTGPGHCYRLYSEEDLAKFEPFTPGEIHLVPLENLVLNMVTLGLSDVHKFPFLEKPADEKLLQAVERLLFLEALSRTGTEGSLELTTLGDAMAKLPVDLTIGKMLITSTIFGVIDTALTMASLMSVQAILNENRFFETKDTREPYVSNHGEPITLLELYKGWLEVKLEVSSYNRRDASTENSRKWCRSRGIEEQRFYEVTKLVQQFREILQDAALIPKFEEGATGRERQMRHGELKQLKRLRAQLKNEAKGTRKRLRHNEEEDEDQDGHDIKDVEFRIVNDQSKVQKLLAETRTGSFRDLMMLKVLLTGALYPQVAVEDEHNSSKTVNERLYHTKYKSYVFLRPTSYFAEHPDFFQLPDSEVEVPPQGYFSKRPLSTKHQLLVFQKLLETKKTYLMNVYRMPALQTLMLFGRQLCVNRACTKMAADDFLYLAIPIVGQGLKLLLEAITIRKELKKLLESKLTHPDEHPSAVTLLEDIIRFMSTSPVYNIKRLLPADVKTIYTYDTDTVDVEMDGVNPFDADFSLAKNYSIGGVQVGEYVTWDALPMNGYDVEVEGALMECCDLCGEKLYSIKLWDYLVHRASCTAKKSTNIVDSSPVPSTSGGGGGNRKKYTCDKCRKDFTMTPVEFLKHKKYCVSVKVEK